MRILSLKVRMTLAVAFLFSLFLVVGTIGGVSYFKREIGRIIAGQQHIVALTVADHIDHMLQVYTAHLQATARKIPADILSRPGAARTFLHHHAKRRGLFHGQLMLLTPTGRLAALAAPAVGRIGKDFSRRAFFRRTLGRKAPAISEPLFLSPRADSAALVFTAPVTDARGRVRAVLAGTVSLQSQELLGALGRISHFDAAEFYLRGPGWSAQLATAAAGRDAATPPRWTLLRPSNGESRAPRVGAGEAGIFAGAPLNGKHWEVVAHFPQDAAFAPLVRAEFLFFAILLPLGVVLAWLVVWLLMRRLTAPLQALTLHVRQMQQGSKHPFSLAGLKSDEIGLLAREFNQLLASVQEHEQQTTDQLLFLQTLLDTIPNPVYYQDAEGDYLGGNKAFETMLGQRREEFVGRPAAPLLPALAAKGRDSGEQATAPVAVAVDETVVRFADGRERAVIAYRAPFFRRDGKAGGGVGILLDISERKRMELALAQAKAFSESLLQNSAVPTFVLGPDHRVLFWNRACERLTALAAEAVLGTEKHWQAFYPAPMPSLADHVIDGLARFEKGQYAKLTPSRLCPEGFQAEGWNQHLGNGGRYIVCDAAPIRDGVGQLVAVIQTVQDMTERKKAEERLRQIAHEVSDRTGEEFFQALAAYLGKVLGADGVVVGEFDKTVTDAVRAIAVYGAEELSQEAATFSLAGSPCEGLAPGEARILPSGVRSRFPDSPLLTRWQAQGYAGMLLTDSTGVPIGLMSLLYRQPMSHPEEAESLLKIFAQRAAAELERRQARASLNQSISLLEATLESTGDGILVMDTSWKITSFNRQFLEMWNLPPQIVQSSDGQIWQKSMLEQLAEPEAFAQGVEHLLRDRVEESHELIPFRDGRVFSRHAKPQYVNRRFAGYVFSYSDVTERKRAERRSQQTLSLLRTTLEATADGILVVDLAGRIALYNQRFVEMWQVPPELLARGDEHRVLDFMSEQMREPERFLGAVAALGREPEAEQAGLVHFRDGRIFETFSGPQRLEAEIAGRVCCFRDITGQKKLERQLNQAQKMEAIGNLAGGVAHDFNNLLTVINGYATLLVRALGKEDALAADAQLILEAGNRAADLTRQLLAFSRRQVLEPQVLDINKLIRNFEKMLRRLIREDITIAIDLREGLGSVLADPGQLEQVLLNLAVNARDAIEGRGEITIATDETEFDESFLQQHPGSVAGRYVMFSVRDTGAGMSEEIQSQIFEPFFTTKESGRGTGLGLATVYGIVKQSAGYITVESRPGRGTLCSVYLPRSAARPAAAVPAAEAPAAVSGGCLLLVEDQREVLRLVAETLSLQGFTVVTATSAEEAMARFSSRKAPIDLLITDVVMPGASGLELADRLRRQMPALPVLFLSGYSDLHSQPAYTPGRGEAFLQKPFTGDTLIAKVEEMLQVEKG